MLDSPSKSPPLLEAAGCWLLGALSSKPPSRSGADALGPLRAGAGAGAEEGEPPLTPSRCSTLTARCRTEAWGESRAASNAPGSVYTIPAQASWEVASFL